MSTLVAILAGALLVLLARGLWLKLTPTRFEAASVMFHTPGSGMSDSGRDFLAMTLTQPDFLPSVATRQGWDAETAAQIAQNIFIATSDASGPIAELRLTGTDPTVLTTSLDAIAKQMVAWHRDKQQAQLQWQLSELDEILGSAIRRERELKAQGEDQILVPPSVQNTLVAVTDLARQRHELELAARYRLRPESAFDTAKRQRRLNDVFAKQKRLKRTIGDNTNVGSADFATAQALAHTTAEVLALQQTQEQLKRELKSFRPLQIVRPAAATTLTPIYIPTEMLATLGGVIGALLGGLVWSKRKPSIGSLRDSVKEGSPRTPVLGVITEFLIDYGERERRPLAATEPGHLVLAGIHSLRMALHILAQEEAHDGPVVITDMGDPHEAAHVVANLAVVAAQAGERVLIVDACSRPGVLSAIFASDEQTMRTAAQNTDTLSGERNSNEREDTDRIHFLFRATSTTEFTDGTLPVTAEFLHDFDRVFIHVSDVAGARCLLEGYGTGIGILVCSSDADLAVLSERADALHGVVLCNYHIDASVYS